MTGIKLTPAQRAALELVAASVVYVGANGETWVNTPASTDYVTVREATWERLRATGLVMVAPVTSGAWSSAKAEQMVLTDLGRAFRDEAPVSVPGGAA